MYSITKPRDWDRSVRHGVGSDKRPLMIMPSEDYCHWTDEDFGALLSHVVTLPAADEFRAMFRSGKRPDGSAINAVMPFAILKVVNDTDLEVLYMHLKTLPPRPHGQR
jgi:hypothetical protein